MDKNSQIRTRLLDSGLARASEIAGCSEQELDEIARVAKRKLPDSYREYMRCFGRGSGKFLRDVEMRFPAVLSLRSDAEGLIACEEEENFFLPESAFVFAIRQREQVMFFEEEGAEPAVMFYMYEDTKFTKVANCFWEIIESELRMAESWYKQVRGTPYDFSTGE